MTRCIPFSVICFVSQSGMTSDGYSQGYVSFAHFCYIFMKRVWFVLWNNGTCIFIGEAQLAYLVLHLGLYFTVSWLDIWSGTVIPKLSVTVDGMTNTYWLTA